MANLTDAQLKRLEQLTADRELADLLRDSIDSGDGKFASVSFTIGAEAANAITVSLQLKDRRGSDLAAAAKVKTYLATAADAQALKNPPATDCAAGTDGTLLVTHGTRNVHEWISEADGDLDIVITDASGAATYYLVVELPQGGISVSSAITFA